MKIIILLFFITFIFSPAVWATETGGITVSVTVEQVKIIEATVEFRPETIRRGHRLIRCYIELPLAYKVEDIDVNTVKLTEVNANPIEPPLKTIRSPLIGDFDRDGIPDLRVWFDIQPFTTLLKVGENTLTVAGNLLDGKKFKATGTIGVMTTRKKMEEISQKRLNHLEEIEKQLSK